MSPVLSRAGLFSFFMADDLSLLFRLRAENTQAKAVLADTRAAVAQLRQSFGPQLTQTVTVASKSFSDLGDNLNNFVAQRVPLVGSAVIRITDGLKGLGAQSPKTQKAVSSVADSIQSIATQSGKTIPQISAFLAKYIQIEGQSKRNDTAFKFFGGSVDLIGNKTAKFAPELEKVGAELAAVSGQSVKAGGSIAAMAGPIGIAVLALAALAVGAVVAAREIFELSKRTAEFQGKMFDLAQQTGLAVETLSALEVEAKKTGGSIDTIAQSMFNFQRKLDDAQDPLSKTAEQFRKFNIDTTDTENSLRSAFNALAAMPEGFAQTNAAAELFGARGGKQVLAILKETNGDIDGTIKRLREAGALITDETARAADRFNDELALLDFQMRAASAALVEELIPAITEMIRTTSELVTASRPLIGLFGTIAGTAIRPVVQAYKGLSLTVQALTGDYKGLEKAIREANEAQNIAPLKVPGVTPTPLPGVPTGQQTASDAVNQADAVLAAVNRKVAEQNQALDTLFQQGRRNRQQQAEETIALNKQQLQAEKARIDAVLAQREQEIKALDEAQRNRGEIASRDSEQYRSITAQIVKLQQERLDKEAEFDVSSRAIRAKAAKERADATRNQIANERDLLLGEFDRTIKDIEAQIARGAKAEEDGLTVIEQLEKAKIDARLDSLQKQKDVGLLTIQDQKDLDAELQKLQQERDRLDDEQQARRLQRERNAAERTREILLSNIDTLLELEQVVGERRIATIQALGDRRVITEEEAAKRILKIRLDLLDDEIEATEARLEAAKSIADKDERIRAQADLNNQLKILKEERVTIETEGNRAVDDARQEDLENERRYADELRDIKERIRDIERDAAEEVIRLMSIHFASRRDIIRARLRTDIADENARHEQALETIENLEQENRESNRAQAEKDAEAAELNRLREAEEERHRLAMQGIKDQGKKDEIKAGPFGGFVTGLESGQLTELANGVQSFADVATVAFSAVGAAVNGLAQGVGGLVQQWVLLGTTGPGAFRKLVASVLAGVAAQAATLAVMELAYGIAALTPWGAAVYGPAPLHFKSAALFGSIAAVAGLAGRSIAGGLFQPGGGAGKAAGSGSREGPQQLDPLTLPRNQPQPQVVRVENVIRVQSNDSHIVKVVANDYRHGGDVRQVIIEDGGPSA